LESKCDGLKTLEHQNNVTDARVIKQSSGDNSLTIREITPKPSGGVLG